jgi:hypothetical protein
MPVGTDPQEETASSARKSFNFGLAAAGLIVAALVSLLAGLSVSQSHRGSVLAEWVPFSVMAVFALISAASLVLSGFHLVRALIEGPRGNRLLWVLASAATYLLWLAVIWFVSLLGGEV